MAKKVIKIFILTTIIFMLLIIVLLLVYMMKIKESPDNLGRLPENKAEAKTEKTGILGRPLPAAEDEEVVRGMIFEGSKEDKNLIRAAYFVNFDRQEGRISFFHLPGSMIFEMSAELYNEMSASFADLPQVVRLSQLYKYNKSKKGLKAAIIMLNDYLGLGLSHFLFLDADDAGKIFYLSEDGKTSFSESFINDVVNGGDEKQREFVELMHDGRRTDIKKETYVKFLGELKEIKKENVKFITVRGDKFDSGVIIKKEMINDREVNY